MTRREWSLAMLASPLWAQFKQKPPEPPEQETVIKVDVDLVNLFCSVRDKNGAYVGNLSKDDFTVFEDGKQQDLKVFVKESDLPLTLGLLVDVSLSQERLIETERSASLRFFQQVLRQKDMAFLISFGRDIELLQDFTNSLTLLRRGLDGLRLNAAVSGPLPGAVPGQTRGTALYDAVFLAADEKLRTEVGRKAMVVITDGMDYGSRVRIEKAIEAAHRSDTVIFGILYEDWQRYGGGGDGYIRRMAEETGGASYRVGRKESLDDIYNRIQEGLRTQYALGYTPTNPARDGGFRKLEIRLRDKNLKVQARKGYYASKS